MNDISVSEFFSFSSDKMKKASYFQTFDLEQSAGRGLLEFSFSLLLSPTFCQ